MEPTPWLSIQAHILHFDRLSAGERQPYSFAAGSALTWDGRLDNREDLLLCLHRTLGSDESDAALVAAAYEQWGLDALPRLIGDWSLAIWDAAQQRIVLARDYLGNRPLYYFSEPGRLSWATHLEALAVCEQRLGMPDDVFITGYITLLDSSSEGTPFAGISRLLPGHVLIASRGSMTVRRYWRYTPTTLRGDVNQHAEQLRLLLTEGVRVRLRSSRPVWTHLSGGWDSSTVTCIAHRLIERRQVEAPAVHPVSVVSSDPESGEERAYMAAVERWCGITTTERPFRMRVGFEDLLGIRTVVTTRGLFDLETPAQAAGHCVVLTGSMGDLTMRNEGGALLALWELFDLGHPVAGLRGLLAFAHHQKQPIAQTFVKALRTRFGTPARLSYRRRSRAERQAAALLHGISPELVERTATSPRAASPSLSDFPRPLRPLVDMLYEGADRDSFGNPEHYVPAIWRTHPYTHRPFIEFLISVPALSLYDPTFPRAGMRRAFKEILPPEILDRRTKTGIVATTIARSKRQQIDHFISTPPLTEPVARWHLVQRGILTPTALTDRIRRQRLDRKPSEFLSRCITIEAWLRSLHSSSDRTPHSTTPAGMQQFAYATSSPSTSSVTSTVGVSTAARIRGGPR